MRFLATPWDGDPGSVGVGTPAAAAHGGPAPRATVDREEYEFGTLDIRAEGKHEFVFTNRGEGTLLLTSGETSCGCAVSKIEDGIVAPGESEKVTVTWKADKGEGPFRHTATIQTNDPARPRVTLTVWGRITRVVRPIPSELVLGQIAAGRPASGQVRLLCYLDEPLEIRGCDLVDEETKDQFEVTSEPLAADQLQKEDGEGSGSGSTGGLGSGGKKEKPERPHSGYLLKVLVKPGLPLGVFRQTILVRTNLKSVPKVEIPLAGTVVGDISIVGRGWNDETGVLTLGTIVSRWGAERRLVLVSRGPHAKEVEFTLVRTNPDLLVVDQERLKETRPIGDGAVTQTPLVIRVPKGSRPADYLGAELGEILIKTTHPQIPLLRIRVRFAVEG